MKSFHDSLNEVSDIAGQHDFLAEELQKKIVKVTLYLSTCRTVYPLYLPYRIISSLPAVPYILSICRTIYPLYLPYRISSLPAVPYILSTWCIFSPPCRVSFLPPCWYEVHPVTIYVVSVCRSEMLVSVSVRRRSIRCAAS